MFIYIAEAGYLQSAITQPLLSPSTSQRRKMPKPENDDSDTESESDDKENIFSDNGSNNSNDIFYFKKQLRNQTKKRKIK